MNAGEITSARVISTRRRSPPDRDSALLFARLRDAELVEQLTQALRALRAASRSQRLEDGEDVLLDGELAEDRRLLRQVADAAAGALVHRQLR